jgi:hypothetical protein
MFLGFEKTLSRFNEEFVLVKFLRAWCSATLLIVANVMSIEQAAAALLAPLMPLG